MQVLGLESASPGGVKSPVPIEVGGVHKRLGIRQLGGQRREVHDECDTRREHIDILMFVVQIVVTAFEVVSGTGIDDEHVVPFVLQL